MDLNEMNLSRNPFKDMTPNRQSVSLTWAGMGLLKRKMESCYDDCLNEESKQMVLNWGPYGGGKTFSAYFFIKKYYHHPSLKHIYLRSPKDGNKTIKELFKGIIDELTFEEIYNQVRLLIDMHSLERVNELLSSKASPEYAKAICLIGSDDIEIKDLMNRFIYSGITKSELKKLGLAKDIQSDSDAIKFLTGILACFAGEPELFNGKMIIWLDEMEDVIYYASKNYKAFSQILRDVYDSFSSNVVVFLNFTLAEGEEQTIETILGGAIWSRITKKIRYNEITDEDALSYVNDLLAEIRIDQNISLPFTVEAILEIISLIPTNNLTPREINRYFNSILKFAIRQNNSNINTNLIASWIDEFEEDI
jgi:hypothetical protein